MPVSAVVFDQRAPARTQADATVTWDGREVLVVGGHYGLSRSALIADGVGYNPATNR